MARPHNFLILGANGAIGSAIAHYLLARGQSVQAVVRPTANVRRLHAIKDYLLLHVDDGQDRAGIASLLIRNDIQAIVNCVYPGGHFVSLEDMHAKLQEANQTMFNLVSAIQHSEFAGELVHLGSALSYGDSPTPFAVTQALNPIVLRGACKAAESILLRQLVRQLPVHYTELRVFTSYGPFEQTERFVPQLLRAALSGEKIALTTSPRWRDWIYNADIADAVLRVVEKAACSKGRDSRDNAGEVFNLCSGELHSTHEVAALAEEIVGCNLIANYDYPGKELYGKPAAGVRPAEGAGLDWQPTHTLAEGLAKSWAWAQTDVARAYLLRRATY